MKSYGVIIVGAGIAGTGLAYNLKQIGYKGSVLVIDKEGVGSNEGHSIRVTFKKVINNYNIPFIHKYKGLKAGINDKVMFTINKPYYVIEYKEACRNLQKRSESDFRKETALNIDNNKLITESETYKFSKLIDCSGTNFFLRNKFNMKLPFRYWIGDLSVVKNNQKISDNYLYYMSSNDGFVEEVNPFKKTISLGSWKYNKNINFNPEIENQNLICKKLIDKFEIIKKGKGIIPISPVLPCSYKNFAFLGDSFGNATSSMAFGIGATLDSSTILANSIINNNLKMFEKMWKKTYLNKYIKYLTVKYDLLCNPKWLRFVKNYPHPSKIINEFKNAKNTYYKFMEDPVYEVKQLNKLQKIFPKRRYLFLLYYNLYLKMKYALMN